MTKDVNIDIDKLPIVALVGRTNVGKSTLFNRLIEEKKAIVSNIPGTTRTSNEGLVLWRGKYFRLVDTGGLTFEENVPLEQDILKQSQRAMKESDLILFLIDGQTDVMPQEKELAKFMRRIITKPVMLVANKVDSAKIESLLLAGEWPKLGLGQPFAVSAINGRNAGDMLDQVFSLLQKTKNKPKKKKISASESIRVSIIGKPNVGKSSLFNNLIGENKVIVSDIPHTTREPHDTDVIYEYTEGKKTIKQKITFVDTAGIRRKTQVSGQLEKEGIRKSIESIEHSDIILFVIDGSESLSSQDMQLGGLLEKRAKSVLLIVNKWDLSMDVSDRQRNEVTKMVYAHFPHIDFAPVLFVSGKTGYRVHQILPSIMKAWQGRHTVIPISALEHFLKQATTEHRPSRGKGTHHPKIMGIRQLGANPPVIELMIKYRTSLNWSYVNFLKNKLRAQFDFFGTPVIIKLTKMKR